MPTLRFPDHHALMQLLADGALPPAVRNGTVSSATDAEGRIWIRFRAILSKRAVVALTQRRIDLVDAKEAPPLRSLSCWPQAVPLVRIPDTASGQTRLRACIPSSLLPSLTADLGHADWSLRFDGDHVSIDARGPIATTIARWRDRADDTIDLLVEQAPRVWITAGWTHPCLGQFEAGDGQRLVLRPGQPWQTEVEHATGTRTKHLTMTGEAIAARSARLPKLTITPRWRPLPGVLPPGLWIIDREAVPLIRELAESQDVGTLARLQVAWARGDTGPIAVLRFADSHRPLVLPAAFPAGHQSLQRLPNLYVPCGSRLSPLPRRDRLRTWLAPDEARVYWLNRGEDDRPLVASLLLSAFGPLLDSIDYHTECTVDEYTSPAIDKVFTFGQFRERQTIAVRPLQPLPQMRLPAPLPEERDEPTAPGLLSRLKSLFTGERGTKPPTAAPEEVDVPPPPVDRVADPPAKLRESHERLREAEREFVGRMASLTAAERTAIWPKLAGMYAQTNNMTEAAVCWLNSVWEQTPPTPAAAWGWLKAEASLARWSPEGNENGEWLDTPITPPRARALASWIVWASLQDDVPAHLLAQSARYQTHLERCEEHLAVKAAWLARSALARIHQGDLLALARTRDHLCARLFSSGLSLDRDVPTFVRFAESASPDRFAGVGKWLAERRPAVRQWIARLGAAVDTATGPLQPIASFGLEAEVQFTSAYADMMIAWGLARLGEKSESQRLRDEAVAALDSRDPVHAFLRDAFDRRISQARDGSHGSGQLPDDLRQRLDELAPDDRYRVDRLRQHSRILGPGEEINAFWASSFRHYSHWDQLRRQLHELPGLAIDEMNARVRVLLPRSAERGSVLLPIILPAVLDLITRLEPDLATRTLDLLPAALDRLADKPARLLALLDQGLRAAAALDHGEVVQDLARRFSDHVDAQRGPLAAGDLPGITGQMFRCLRRLGLKSLAEEILTRLHHRLTNEESIPQLRARHGNAWPGLLHMLLHVAAGCYYCGRDVEGHRIIDEARYDLYQSPMNVRERTPIAMTYAATLGQIPVRLALSRFDELFQRLRKVSINSWNSHYTLTPLQLIDTTVLAVVDEDFTLGPAVRGFVDDEEHRIRRRLSTEIGDLMRQQGVAS